MIVTALVSAHNIQYSIDIILDLKGKGQARTKGSYLASPRTNYITWHQATGRQDYTRAVTSPLSLEKLDPKRPSLLLDSPTTSPPTQTSSLLTPCLAYSFMLSRAGTAVENNSLPNARTVQPHLTQQPWSWYCSCKAGDVERARCDDDCERWLGWVLVSIEPIYPISIGSPWCLGRGFELSKEACVAAKRPANC